MTAASPVTAAPKVETPLKRFVVEFLDSRVAVLGLALLVLIVVSALFAPLIAPQDPYDLSKLDIMNGMLPPGSADMDENIFWLGSDEQGRDLLSAILYGLRTSLLVGFSSTAVALAVGLLVGMIAAYAGGSLDAAIMRLVDIQLSFPAILIALILLAVLGKGIDKVIIALTAVQWAYYARTVRSAALVERRKEYVEAAQCLALPKQRIVLRHLLPNCLPPLIVVATVQVAHAITLEATLSCPSQSPRSAC